VHQDDEGPEPGERTVTTQFGDLMRDRREELGWSQRQLAEALHTVDLRLDPSAITRIERGTRDVKLSEAIAIATILGFSLDEITFSPVRQFMTYEWNELQLAIRARKALLDALRHYDRWANNTDPETEQGLVERRGLKDISELYTQHLSQSRVFQWGERLGHLPGDGDNYAVSYNEIDHAIKAKTVELITNAIIVTEDEFTEIIDRSRKRTGKALASLIPPDPAKDDDAPSDA